ncbi:MAG TPA: hypothetical protein VMU32_03105 [Solirubrobacteraceae bacterium]|nr:hypothetical protein [Solirubrobacteraceae bacterium]
MVCSFCCLTICAAAPPVAQAAFGVYKWEAATCKEEGCNAEGKDPGAEFYTQVAGHPNFGITDFAFNYSKSTGVLGEVKTPEGHVRNVRVDLPAGLAVNPEAVPTCSEAEIAELNCPESTRVGTDEAEGTAEVALGVKKTVTEPFPVYNIERRPGESARFAVEVKGTLIELAEAFSGKTLKAAIYLEGGISWHSEGETSENSGVASGDYHEYFKIQNIPTQPELVESKLIFWGVPHEHEPAEPDNAFITMPSAASDCAQPQTTYLHVASYEDPGSFQKYADETRLNDGKAITATGCETLTFAPSFTLTPQTTQSDLPDGPTFALHIPQHISEPAQTSSPELRTAEVALPEGMTLNPSAAHGLEGCSNAQIGLGTDQPITCPAGSEIGIVAIDAPGIPDGSLAGKIYLGAPEPNQGPESGREFRIFLAAEAAQYDVGVRLEGRVKASKATGRLTATFENDPEVPFEDFVLEFRGGPRATLANPLTCGPAEPVASLTPYTGQPPVHAATHGFVVDGNGKGGSCPAPLPFALSQSTPPQNPPTAGAYSPLTFDLARGDGQQYLSTVRTVLPPGLLGDIPSVPLCSEAQASSQTCPSTSEIGTVTVAAGSGPEPYAFTGHVYLTAAYAGAPYGLAITVPALAGPYDLGVVPARAQITVDPNTARVIVTAAIPTIWEGVPLRLKDISLAVNRPNFLFNPTNCAALATESTLTSTLGATQALASPFQVGECSKLPFKPALGAETGPKPTRLHGAKLEVKITQPPHQANIRAVEMTLPKQLSAQEATLRKACPSATFEAGPAPGGCPETARVGSVTVTTPVLPGKLEGPAYLVSHGGQAFPDLDLIVRGDGIQVVLVGHTFISPSGVTSSKFETLPDVPVTAVAVDLPTGPQALLSAHADPCRAKLVAPTTLISQSGVKLTQQTTVAVHRCPVEILHHRTSHRRLLVKLHVPAAGLLVLRGHGLKTVRRRLAHARTLTVKVPLTRAGRARLASRHKFRTRLVVKFKAKSKSGAGNSKANAAVIFRRPRPRKRR